MEPEHDDHDVSNKSANYASFRDFLFASIVGVLGQSFQSPTSRHKGGRKYISKVAKSIEKPSAATDPAELAEFSDYISGEIFPYLPSDLQTLSYQQLQDNAEVAEKWSLPLTLSTIEEAVDLIPPEAADNMIAYGLIEPPKSDLQSFISPVLASYITAVTTPPPKWIETRATACEICDREWIPLTYHHLIPKGVHAKVLKRGWHDEQKLNSVAWLCRACHTFVHKMASNEELARDWYTIDKICSRDDTQKWAQWVARVRWKKT